MLLLPLSAMAQEKAPKAEVFAGYSFLRESADPLDPVYEHGFNGSVAGNLNKNFGVVGDFGVYRFDVLGINGTTVTYMGGPRVSVRSDKVDPFFHALFGGARSSALGVSDNAFAFALGGGLDVKATRNVAVRVAQFEYMGTRFGGETQDGIRFSAGIVFRLGR